MMYDIVRDVVMHDIALYLPSQKGWLEQMEHCSQHQPDYYF